jgi:hypothetical protein
MTRKIGLASAFVAMTLVTCLIAGCSEESGEGEVAPAENGPSATEGGMAGITLEVPSPWVARSEGNETTFWRPEGWHFTLYVLPAGKSAEDAVDEVAEIIADKVTDFKVTETADVAVAGRPAKRLVGTGVEADDGDPSNAEVYVFSLGGRVRVACVHGEGDAREKLRPMALGVLEQAKAE